MYAFYNTTECGIDHAAFEEIMNQINATKP